MLPALGLSFGLILGAPALPGALPDAGRPLGGGALAAQERAQELIRQRTGRSLSQEEILDRIRSSGIGREEARRRLRQAGQDPSLADPYFDRLEGRGDVALPEPTADFLSALQEAGIAGTGAGQGGGGAAPGGGPLFQEVEGVPPGGGPLRARIDPESRVRVRHLLFPVPATAPPSERERMRERAREAHLRILSGEPFERVAADLDDVARLADLGWLERGVMPPAFDSVAFSLEPGRVSGPVETSYGVHLIRVDDRETLEVFGKAVFSRPTSQFQAVTTGPVDPSYRLGPGDELILILTGDVELAYTLEVTREGYVVIPDVGQLPVNGLTLDELEDRLYDRLGQVYSGVTRGPDASTRFDVSLGSLRTNVVFVIGDVERPGAYQVSSLARAFHALHRAGGPTEEGSFRNVQVRRGGGVAARIDLYEYLLRGDASQDVRLEQGDIVFVPGVESQVAVRGRVRRPARFELAEGEGIEEVLHFAGGLEAEAHGDRIQVDRILPPEDRTPDRERVLRDVDLAAVRAGELEFPLRDGDRIEVFGLSAERRNRVQVRGDVWRPGRYEFTEGMTVRELVERAGGLRPAAFRRVAHVVRLDLDTGGTELHRVALEPGGGDLSSDLELQDRDEVVVFSVDELVASDSVTVSGMVKKPGRYALSRGMTAEDLILAAGGFRRGAHPYRAEVARTRLDLTRSDTLTVRFPVELRGEIPYPGGQVPSAAGAGDGGGLGGGVPGAGGDAPAPIPAERLPLEEGDWVMVRPVPGFEPTAAVRVTGQVVNPGTYVLEEREETVSQLLRRAGGLTDEAHLEGFRLVRDNLPVGMRLPEALAEPGGPEDVILEDGDSLVVPRFDQTVEVRGAVAFDARVLYHEGWDLGDYLDQAGGPLDVADDERISVEYPNGERAIVKKRTFFFDRNPEVLPGSVIYVPRESPDEGVDLDRILTRSLSVLSTLATALLVITRF